MRFIFHLIFLLVPMFCYADAGFNIRRDKAPCYAVFKGIDKLDDYELFKVSKNDERRSSEIILDSSYQLKDNDSVRIYYTEGRRYWEGPIKILIREKATKLLVDSFVLTADGYHLTINFAGVENGKVKYTVDKRKAHYPYQLFAGDDADDPSVAKRNKIILISFSVISFLVIAFMIYKRKNNTVS